MLQIPYIRDNKEDVLERLETKNFKNIQFIDQLIDLDNQRKQIQASLDRVLAEQNLLAKQIAGLMKEGDKTKANEAKTHVSQLKDGSKQLENQIAQTERDLQELLVQIPNLPHHTVPKGTHAEHNEVVFEVQNIPTLNPNALPHWELTQKYDIIDFELGVKITGAGFPVYKGKGSKLQRALINFFLDQAADAGYTEYQPPLLVNEASGFGTGQLPDKESQMYHVGLDDFYLIPTAEVPITNLFRDTIVKEHQLPIKSTAYTPCFRREAGSYGKDVRGLNRLHQFDKVEIVQIAHPEQSYELLEQMKDYVAGLLQKLELPYRVLRLCGGDMSFASALTYDLEVWSAAQKRWLEVSSVSNFESFQANRLKCRYKSDVDGKNQLVHTLNGSALALPRIVASLLENNQTEQGIRIPKILVPYTGFEFIN